MGKLNQLCPTFMRWAIWLWNSPTFTTWGNYGAQSLRLLLVTPLILTRFDETEIAAWYLFASLNFFGTTVAQRLGLTFSRMFAFAMGGASNLEPITGKRMQENEGQPNWNAFERAYGTIGSLNLAIGGVNVVIAFGMGWFALSNLLAGYEAKGTIWLAFGLMQGSSLLSFIFQRYGIALRGMNYIALVNRWGIITSFLSVLAGGGVLLMGGGIIALVFVMQFFGVVGLFLYRFLLRTVEGGRVLKLRQYGFNREVFGWAWAPTWKGMLMHMSDLGVVQLSGIALAKSSSPSQLAAYLLSVRLVQVVAQVSGAPFGSHQPLFGRLLSSADIGRLRKLYLNKVGYSMILMGLGLAGLMFFGDRLLGLINSNVSLLKSDQLLLLSLMVLHMYFVNYQGALCGVANNIILVASAVLTSTLTITLIFGFSSMSTSFIILAVFLPRIIIFNVRPGVIASKLLEMSAAKYIGAIYGFTALASFFVTVSYLLR